MIEYLLSHYIIGTIVVAAFIVFCSIAVSAKGAYKSDDFDDQIRGDK
jgi:hypothetical protein